MSELTPQQTAEVLKISTQTLRRWSVQFAEFLGPDATPGRGRRRQYSVDDLATFRRIADLLHNHRVDDTLALLRVTPDQESTQALETLALPDLIAEAKALRDALMQLRGDVAALQAARQSDQAEIDRLRSEVAGLFDRQRKRQDAQNAELEEMRAQLADLQARRHWWQRLRG